MPETVRPIDIDAIEAELRVERPYPWSPIEETALIREHLDAAFAEIRRLREERAESESYEKHKWDLFLEGLAAQWREMAELPDGVPDPQLLIAWATGTIKAMREEARWIPVGERLPDRFGRVLAVHHHRTVYALFSNGGFYEQGNRIDPELWRPLPAPPEVEP